MGSVTLTLEEYNRLVEMATSVPQNTAAMALLDSTPKPAPRKVSKYSKQFGKEMKALIKKHPRSKVTVLMKRAHKATRKSLK